MWKSKRGRRRKVANRAGEHSETKASYDVKLVDTSTVRSTNAPTSPTHDPGGAVGWAEIVAHKSNPVTDREKKQVASPASASAPVVTAQAHV